MSHGLAVVTGASTGVGYDVAHQMVQDGYDTLLVAPEPTVAEASESLRALGGNATHLEVDLTTPDGREHLWRVIQGLGRPVEALVVTAGGVDGAGNPAGDLDGYSCLQVVQGTLPLLRTDGEAQVLVALPEHGTDAITSTASALALAEEVRAAVGEGVRTAVVMPRAGGLVEVEAEAVETTSAPEAAGATELPGRPPVEEQPPALPPAGAAEGHQSQDASSASGRSESSGSSGGERSSAGRQTSSGSSPKGRSSTSGSRGRRSSGSGGQSSSADSETTREELYEQAQRLDIPGRSGMSKDELVKALRKASGSGSGPSGGGSGSGVEVDPDATREELYEQAQRLDIPGRSGMSKDELVKALRKASR